MPKADEGLQLLCATLIWSAPFLLEPFICQKLLEWLDKLMQK